MGKVVRPILWLLAAVALAYDIFLWGGLSMTPVIGPRLREQASMETPIAALYLGMGRQSVIAAGKVPEAVAFAERQFPGDVLDTDSARQSIVPRFLAAQSTVSRLAYYGAPVLLVLSLVLHLLRQKPIRSLGRKG